MKQANELAKMIYSWSDYAPSDGVKVFRDTGEEIEGDEEDAEDDVSESLREQAEDAFKGGVTGVFAEIDPEAYSHECSACEVQESHTPAWSGASVAAATKEDLLREVDRFKAWNKKRQVKEAHEALEDFSFHASHLTDEEVLAALKEAREKDRS